MTLRRDDVLGIVLAGGRSSRMGQDKAFLPYRGKPLIYHMLEILLESGTARQIVSGAAGDWESFADDIPFQGPAHAMLGVLRAFRVFRGILFVPVDMPFLDVRTLQWLMQRDEGAWFEDNPLPAYIAARDALPATLAGGRVRTLLEMTGATCLPTLPCHREKLGNFNTPQEWASVASHEH